MCTVPRRSIYRIDHCKDDRASDLEKLRRALKQVRRMATSSATVVRYHYILNSLETKFSTFSLSFFSKISDENLAFKDWKRKKERDRCTVFLVLHTWYVASGWQAGSNRTLFARPPEWSSCCWQLGHVGIPGFEEISGWSSRRCQMRRSRTKRISRLCSWYYGNAEW